jgi:D-glycero-D-manno-heptose 1,7-bisphosphate phosphatase
MSNATIRQCAILVGGLGSRLGAITASTPKPILPCGDRPFLAWLMRELLRYGVSEFLLLTGHLSVALESCVGDIADRLPRPVTLAFSEEPFRAGTGGALFHARDRLDSRFLLCNGDSLFDFNLGRLLAAAADDEPGVVGRIALRRLADASRFGTVDLDGERITAFRERPPASSASDHGAALVPGVINAGVYLFDRRLTDDLSPDCSLERDALPRLASRGVLRGTLGEGYFRDIGIAEDLRRAQTEIPQRLRRPALFLDRDGTINVNHGWVGSRERFDWIPGALAAIRAATEAGWHVFVVTNQSGVARGLYDETALRDLHDWMTDEIRRAGGTIDDIRYCPFHEDADLPAYRRASDWRKPGPGMILDLIRTWELDPARCVLVGDQPSDLAAASAAGIAGALFPGGNLADVVLPILRRFDAECGIDAQARDS